MSNESAESGKVGEHIKKPYECLDGKGKVCVAEGSETRWQMFG